MGGAGQDDRSGGKGGAAAEKFDDFGDGEDHVVRAPVLDGFAVEKSADLEILGIGNFVGFNEAGTEGTESIEGFSATPLAAPGVFLPIAGADIIGAGVARHIVESFGCGDIFTIPSDDHGEFAFVIDLVALKMTRELNGISRILERGDAFGEKNGVFGKGGAHFRRMPAVVESNGKDLSRSQRSKEFRDIGFFTGRLEAVPKISFQLQGRPVSLKFRMGDPALGVGKTDDFHRPGVR